MHAACMVTTADVRKEEKNQKNSKKFEKLRNKSPVMVNALPMHRRSTQGLTVAYSVCLVLEKSLSKSKKQ